MGSKSIQKKIKKLKAALKWNVTIIYSGEHYCNIISDPIKREHYIYLPTNPIDQLRPIEYLHELCHATLAERVHHQFSAQYFKKGTPDHVIHCIKTPCRTASDWYADHMLFQLVPDHFQAEVAEHFNIIVQAFNKKQTDRFLDFAGGIIVAQAIRYLGKKVCTDGDLNRIVSSLLATDPAKPSIQAMENLVNRLLRIAGGYQVRLVNEGLDVWEVSSL